MRPSRLPVVVALVASVAFLAAPRAAADDRAAVDALNAPMLPVPETSRSWKPLFDAYLAMSPAPTKGLDALAVWPGMENWQEVSAWAAANGAMGEAILAAQQAVAFGMPYGRDAVGPTYVERGVVIRIGEGEAVFRSEPLYLGALDIVTAWVTAEMYRLGAEKQFDRAFDLGLATLRLLRQVADQHLLEEKVWALQEMADMASIQRDVLQTFLDEIPAETVKRMALTGYAFIRSSDGERLRRLDMPEGDRVLAEVLIGQLFDAGGQPEAARFASTMGDMQAKDEPLSAFGAARRWQQIAALHGSKDQTIARLTNMYDDWWRRWRLAYRDKLLDNPTVISRTNGTRYAMVLLAVKDLERVFALRQRLNAELNGTVLAFGLCARYRASGWPTSFDQTYTQFTVKRFDRDPWSPRWGMGSEDRWQYERLSAPRDIETDFGRLQVSGAMLYSVGVDGQDGGAVKATMDGVTGDFVAWPALRALARAQGAAK